ncbi:IPT/TIG domain-containing protein [Capillimicrobium parvum]|uniref:IPT/TIG domain-containing protein n=1 Tax=Capillimicrobium parvum TaxID=2884022 RepID=A0A9E7BZ35_9ACTN|nr:IPT/TIG domain-containing protein [Capillimicrobium parvum]UGS34154.1 hypothetical protein DSM104329_00526 [Capillimicrobium parvum]
MAGRTRWLTTVAAAVVAGITAVAPAQAVTVRLGPPTLAPSTSYAVCPIAQPTCSYVFGSIVAPGGVLQAPADGTITAWRLMGQGPGVTLIVAHADGDAWAAAQESAPATSLDGTAMTTSLPVLAGDRIGATLRNGEVAVIATPTATRLLFAPALGATPTTPTQSYTGYELQLNADVTLTAPAITSLTSAAGPLRNGPPVTIAGAHLANATAVAFGSTPATIVSNTNSAIVVRPPDRPSGAVDVTVTVPGGTATARYRYFETPVVTDLAPNSGPTAGGTSVVIRGSGFEGATRVAFGDAAARVVSVAATRIEAVSPPHAAGAVDVTVANPGATSATSVADGFTYGDVAPAGPGQPPAPQAGTRLVLKRLAIAPTPLHRTTTARITYRLNGAASVRFTLRRRVRGHLRKVRSFTDRGAKGANARTFSADGLSVGRYVLSAQGKDAAGTKSRRVRLGFRVRR